MDYLDLPNFQLSVGDIEDAENVYATSLVNDPATRMKVQVFSNKEREKEKQLKDIQLKFAQMPATNEYQRIISGVWMIPDTKYYRNVEGFEFTVSFTKAELKKALLNYLKNDYSNYFDYEHNGQLIDNLISIEHWIIESKDTRSPIMGYSLTDLGYLSEEVKIGTVMKTVYVKDEQFFNELILTNMVTGFSIDGFFNLKEIDTMVTEQFSNKKMFEALGLEQINGTVITNEGNLAFNRNTITLNDVKVIDGEYKTQLGFNIVIKKGAVVDFGFEEVQASVASESATNEQVEVKVETVEPIVAVVEPIVEVTPVIEAPAEVAVVAPVVVDTSKDDLIAAQLAELTDLKEKLALETKEKEELLLAQPIQQKVVTTAPSDLTKFIVREKGGQKHYIPKR